MNDKETNDKEPAGRPANMLCPICKVDLVMAERQGIEIDYCSQCRGVWLDRGELDKIIERTLMREQADLIQEQAKAVGHRGRGRGAQGFREDHHGRSGYRRRSWLHDLFD